MVTNRAGGHRHHDNHDRMVWCVSVSQPSSLSAEWIHRGLQTLAAGAGVMSCLAAVQVSAFRMTLGWLRLHPYLRFILQLLQGACRISASNPLLAPACGVVGVGLATVVGGQAAAMVSD